MPTIQTPHDARRLGAKGGETNRVRWITRRIEALPEDTRPDLIDELRAAVERVEHRSVVHSVDAS